MNFNIYLSHQMAEDRRSFIVYFPAKSGKTQFARRICELRSDAYYLDLQSFFLEHPELPAIGDCDFEAIKKILLELKVTESIVIVDNPDFLFNTWDKDQKKEFLNWINKALRSPSNTQKVFAFFFQEDQIFFNVKFDLNIHRESRLLPLDAFEALSL